MAKVIVLLIALIFSGPLQAQILVIVNARNPVIQMEQKQVVDLFMGRTSVFPDRQPAQTLDLKTGTSLRANFYKTLTGKSEAQRVQTHGLRDARVGTFPNRIRHARSTRAGVRAASSSIIGAICRQGPHQVAQKSTSTT